NADNPTAGTVAETQHRTGVASTAGKHTTTTLRAPIEGATETQSKAETATAHAANPTNLRTTDNFSQSAMPAAQSVVRTGAAAAAAHPATAAATVAMVAVHEPNTLAAATPATSLIDAIGSLVFTVYNQVMQLLAGPPVLPRGSTVTVRTSTLYFGKGNSLPADWYFPNDPNPTGLIFLQHGLLVSAPLYSYTAATLAEKTNSIVVAPSVTSNPFTTNGFWLNGAEYQTAVAGLFTGDRQALTASASAALGRPVTLPTRVVLAGHSDGAGLVLAAANDMVANGTIGNVAGILLLDGANDYNIATNAIDKGILPVNLPIYQLSAEPSTWDNFDAAGNALVQTRPHDFSGVKLVGGTHLDSMQGANPILHFIADLVVGFPFPAPKNIDAVKTLAVGWVNDMFAGTANGIYGSPGESITIPTSAGPATATVLPVPSTGPTAAAGQLASDRRRESE
ncbi:alpha/beta hydrolase, partial [Mycolicibacterium sp. CBMA 335]|uniref:alpha/beta hydrolase n=3 Tax=Mycolicibacterium TaxID=1866885 RepID=UPI001EE4506E